MGTPEPIHVQLLRAEPLVALAGCQAVRAHQARDVFELWERWESATGSEQPPPFWSVVWPGAALLCRTLLAQPELVRGRRVVDIGCGSGVVAVAAMLAGADQAIANDTDAAAVEVALMHARLNGVELMPWCGDLADSGLLFGGRDLIVMSEVFYDSSGSERLRALAARAAARGARILVADGGRAFLAPAGLELLSEAILPVDAVLEGVGQRLARVFEWRPEQLAEA